MAETLTLTVPVPAAPAQTTATLSELHFDFLGQRLTFVAHTNTGQPIVWEEAGAQALTTMRAINVANGAVKSLHKRALEYMVSKGVLAGTISGSPD